MEAKPSVRQRGCGSSGVAMPKQRRRRAAQKEAASAEQQPSEAPAAWSTGPISMEEEDGLIVGATSFGGTPKRSKGEHILMKRRALRRKAIGKIKASERATKTRRGGVDKRKARKEAKGLW